MLKNHILSYLTEANPGQPLPPLGILINSRKCYINFEPQNEILILKTDRNMEIVNIEARTFEAMAERFKQFVQRVNNLCRLQSKELKKWLDNQEVCMILNISKRTLQTYRDNGTLPYSQINHKMYYKPEDVERVLNQLKNKPYGE
jgi:hypothetical protein